MHPKETLMNPLLMRTVCALASTLITLATLQGIDSLAKPSQTDPRIGGQSATAALAGPANRLKMVGRGHRARA
jgi:hypothetical protein